MIHKLEEIKNAFATHKQGFKNLVSKDESTGEYCLCAEAVLGVVDGMTIEQKYFKSVTGKYELTHQLLKNGVYYNTTVPLYDNGLNIPSNLKKSTVLNWQKELELTQEQIDIITDYHTCLDWWELNDVVKLTFHQFSLLIDLLDKL